MGRSRLIIPRLMVVLFVVLTVGLVGTRRLWRLETITIPSVPRVVKLNWQASTQADSYAIFRATRPSNPYRKIGVSRRTEFLDFPLSGPGTLFYTVSAVNPRGESASSARVVVSLP